MTWPVEFAMVLDQQSFTTGWDSWGPKVIFRVKNRNVMPNFGTNQDLTSGDNLFYKLSPTNGWTDIGNSSSSGTYYWFPYSAGNAQLTLLHISNYSHLGQPPSAHFYAVYFGTGVPGGNNTWYHGARMLVR